MKIKLDKIKATMKQLLLTKEGWFAWIVANVITSIHWVSMIVIGFITQNEVWYGYAAAAWAIGMSPFIPLWLFNILIATWLMKLLSKKQVK